MGFPAKISDRIVVIDFQSMETTPFVDRRSGEVVVISDEEFSAVRNKTPLEEFPEWRHDNIKIAREVLDHEEEFLILPDKFDIDEYRMMEKFSFAVEDDKTSDALCRAIKGGGAFRRFKDTLHRFGIADDWYKYHDEEFRKIAIEWCEENNIEFLDE